MSTSRPGADQSRSPAGGRMETRSSRPPRCWLMRPAKPQEAPTTAPGPQRAQEGTAGSLGAFWDNIPQTLRGGLGLYQVQHLCPPSITSCLLSA